MVYMGPPKTARVLPTVVAIRLDEAKTLPAKSQAGVLAPRASRWEDLAVPREIIEALAEESQCSIMGVEQVPHDLWPAMDLPPLTFVERLSLVLCGFDLTFEFNGDGSAVRIVPMPEKAVLVRTYSVRGQLDRISEDLSRQFPHTRVRRVGPRLEVSGPFEDHRLIARLLRGEKVQRTMIADEDKRYSLAFENQPVGGLVNGLARQLDLELVVDPRVQPLLHQQIKFRVQQVTLTQLLTTALEGTGIEFRLQGKTLILSVAE
jgi:hypothetical protein